MSDFHITSLSTHCTVIITQYLHRICCSDTQDRLRRHCDERMESTVQVIGFRVNRVRPIRLACVRNNKFNTYRTHGVSMLCVCVYPRLCVCSCSQMPYEFEMLLMKIRNFVAQSHIAHSLERAHERYCLDPHFWLQHLHTHFGCTRIQYVYIDCVRINTNTTMIIISFILYEYARVCSHVRIFPVACVVSTVRVRVKATFATGRLFTVRHIQIVTRVRAATGAV